jgi:hypothetical protein
MTRSRKLLLVIIALAVLADFLPVTREEFSWWWAEMHDHSTNYQKYISVWPNGRHVAQARILIEERERSEATRAQIRQATQTKFETDTAYRREQRARKDNFFWKQASTANTVESYNDYLREFPQGKYSAQARQNLQALGKPPGDANK